MELAKLPTEQHREDLADLDLWEPRDLAGLMISDSQDVVRALEAVKGQLGEAVAAIAGRLETGTGRMIYIGAGTAGRIGLLDASECGPTFNTDRVIGILAGGENAFGAPREAVEDDDRAAVADLDSVSVGSADAVVGISASGRTPYTVAAVQHARERGALTIGVSCNPSATLSRHCDLAIEVVTGPELIAGSTRLKAGTAQKVVCNTLSTGVMVQLGKTYGNLMVDVRATNEKLRHRARQIVVAATQAEDHAVDEALAGTDGDVKQAIVALLLGIGPAEAARRLRATDGSLRAALEGRS